MPHLIALLKIFVLFPPFKGHLLCISVVFFHHLSTLAVNCLHCSHSIDLLALWECSFSRTRPLTTVKLSSLHLLLVTPVSLFFIHSHLTLSLLPLPTTTTHPYSPPRLRSCSFIPRGEEQTPIITQVSFEMNHWVADWAAWWETSILNSTTKCAQPSTSSLCWCLGLPVHILCHCWERQGVVCSHCVL